MKVLGLKFWRFKGLDSGVRRSEDWTVFLSCSVLAGCWSDAVLLRFCSPVMQYKYKLEYMEILDYKYSSITAAQHLKSWVIKCPAVSFVLVLWEHCCRKSSCPNRKWRLLHVSVTQSFFTSLRLKCTEIKSQCVFLSRCYMSRWWLSSLCFCRSLTTL